jgi:Family of unknown function (DUF5329)
MVPRGCRARLRHRAPWPAVRSLALAIATALLLPLSMALPTVAAAAVQPLAQIEIAHLLDFVRGSGCDLYRNGSRYSAMEGAAHLEDKYQMLAREDEIATAEDFIARAGSMSSMSGRAYQVRCGTDAPIDTGPWLRAELARYRFRQGGNPAAGLWERRRLPPTAD